MSGRFRVAIHELGNGKFQLSYNNPVSGKRTRHKFDDIEEAERHRRKILSRWEQDEWTQFSDFAVEDLLATYLQKHPNAKIVGRGMPFYNSFVATFGKMRIIDVRKTNLTEWFEKIRLERGYAPRTLPNIKSAFNQFFKYLLDEGVIKENPLDRVILKKGPAVRPRIVLSKEDLQEILRRLKEISPQQVYPVIYFLASTGCRLGEALKLKWDQVDFAKGTAHFLGTKNGEDRLIHLSPQALEFLKAHEQRGEHVFFDVRDGLGWDMGKYRKQFEKARRKIAFKDKWTNHCLRHSFAYHYMRETGNVAHLQALLGHRSIQMTADLYGKISARDVEVTTPYSF